MRDRIPCHCNYPKEESQWPITSDETILTLLQSNNAPTDLEISQVTHDLIDVQRHLLHLNASSQQNHDEVHALQKSMLEYKVILGPFRKLPTEILRIIFFLVVDRYAALDLRAGFWNLAQVCARVRSIILNAPRFWTYIVIDPRETDDTFPTHAKSILRTFLKRSADEDICIDFRLTDPALYERAIPLLEILFSASHRLSSFRFRAGTLLCRSLIQLKGRIPRLQQLTIDVSQDSDESGDPRIADVFEDCPQLFDAYVTHYQRSSTFLRLPWPQLNRYLVELSTTDKLDVLCQAQNLTNLLVTAPLDSTPLSNAVELPNLQRLSLFQSATILERLCLPALREVCFLGHSDSFVGPLSTAIQESGFTLQMMQLITGSSLDDTATLKLFQLCPTLQKLNVLHRNNHVAHTCDAFLALLTDTRSRETCLLPNLKHLILDLSGDLVFDKERSIAMLASRTSDASNDRGIHRILTLILHYEEDQPPITLDTLESLQLSDTRSDLRIAD